MKITDYFIYDRANDNVVCWDNGNIVFYGDLEEAIDDLYGNEEVLSYDELPPNWQKKVLKEFIEAKTAPYLTHDAHQKLNKTVDECSNKELRILHMEQKINVDFR